MRGAARPLLWAAGAGLVVCYLAQYLTAPPNSTEGGVVFNYVHRVSIGQRVFFDFFDYYGPVTWYLPSLFYSLAGQQIIGVRVYLLLVKGVTVLLGYGLVRRLTDPFHAALAAATLTALVGLPWAFFQVPYAAHLTLPLALAAWWLALSPSGPPSRARLAAAGLLTAAILWTKVSTGSFVFAGIAFHLFYHSPESADTGATARGASAFRALQLVGLAAYVFVFHAFIRTHASVLFLAYLSAPLLILVGWTTRRVIVQWREHVSFEHSVRITAAYVAWTVGAAVAYLFLYFGTASRRYLVDQLETLKRLKYERPFPPLGVPGPYRGFNEWFWPQLPWLTTIALTAWLFVLFRRREAPALHSSVREGHLVGFAAMVTLHGFVIYSRAGEPQLIQAIMPAALALFVFVYHLEQLVTEPGARRSSWRWVLGVGTALGLTTIVSLPSMDAFDFTRGDWTSPRLRYLKFHPREVPYFTDPTGAEYQEIDRSLDDAAGQVAALTTEGETVLVLTGAELLNYASGTRPVGGKYSPLFYLLRAGMLDRDGFLALLPPGVFHELVSKPPRVMVGESIDNGEGDRDVGRLLRALPELRQGLERAQYDLVGTHGLFEVYLRQSSLPTASENGEN